MSESVLNRITSSVVFNSFLSLSFDPFRTSQFIVGLNKYLEAVNHNKFSVGMRFKMRFEGEDSPERRYSN